MKASAAAYTKNILSTALRHCNVEGPNPTSLPGFAVVRREKTSEATPGMYTPCVCLVLQGEKQVWVGDKVYRYNPSSYLVSCLDIPAVAQVSVATVKEPFVCLKLELQASVVYDILKATLPAAASDEDAGGFYVEKVTPELAEAFIRLLKALDHEDDAKVLAPAIVREIHYRLMGSRYGAKIRELGMVGSKTQRISKVVEQLRQNYAAPLRVPELAQMANMSPSAFHLHFRQVTKMSPLQYQKHIRLQEARRLLSIEASDAASVAYQVGYESPSQFSREYRRFFGQPPVRDMERLRNAAAQGTLVVAE